MYFYLVDVLDYCVVYFVDILLVLDNCVYYYNCSVLNVVFLLWMISRKLMLGVLDVYEMECIYFDLFDVLFRSCRIFIIVICNLRLEF